MKPVGVQLHGRRDFNGVWAVLCSRFVDGSVSVASSRGHAPNHDNLKRIPRHADRLTPTTLWKGVEDLRADKDGDRPPELTVDADEPLAEALDDAADKSADLKEEKKKWRVVPEGELEIVSSVKRERRGRFDPAGVRAEGRAA
ncbi:hypothetical protein EYF80_034425 [Liparis tanakae]|uniref:Uncharacterized protein n=1 Tax=Liparis tanakae TaxID=230148 RepID=A0A4Z2GRL5_9TELE|nr:hypothetical protein EYF80_034425 [Liparis tanakae]